MAAGLRPDPLAAIWGLLLRGGEGRGGEEREREGRGMERRRKGKKERERERRDRGGRMRSCGRVTL